MSIRFKDLCLDVADTPRMARFWSAVLGLETEFRGDDARLGDGVDEHTVWLNRVPEPRTVKHRVHLDVHAAAVDDLVACGATVLHTAPAWTVLTDPEGGEFCAFVRDDPPSYRLYGISVDTADETSLARWWADRFETELRAPAAEDHCWVPATAGLPCDLVFAAVPEPKRSKNRWHLDVWGDVDELVAAGATLLRRRDQEIAWNVLADPEGNEFCVFFPPA